MSVHVSIRVSEEVASALSKMASDLGISRAQIIVDALVAYGVVSAEEGFTGKVRATISELLGVSGENDLIALIDARIEERSREILAASECVQLRGHIEPEISNLAENLNPSQPAGSKPEGTRYKVLTQRAGPDLVEALQYVIPLLESGQNIAVRDVATKYGFPANSLSTLLGVSGERISIKGTRVRYYTADHLEGLKAKLSELKS